MIITGINTIHSMIICIFAFIVLKLFGGSQLAVSLNFIFCMVRIIIWIIFSFYLLSYCLLISDIFIIWLLHHSNRTGIQFHLDNSTMCHDITVDCTFIWYLWWKAKWNNQEEIRWWRWFEKVTTTSNQWRKCNHKSTKSVRTSVSCLLSWFHHNGSIDFI